MSSQAPTHAVFRPGDRCGPFQITRPLGHGGMGEVYLACSPDGRQRAIKVLSPKARVKGEIASRFTREVQLLSYIDHVHVVRFYETGVLERDGRTLLWVALEYLEGRSLREIISMHGGKLSIDKLIRWGRHIAQGVHEAHKLKVIHRDLKPENIIIGDKDVAKVFDFGIAKFRDWGQKTTMGSTLGTLLYMAPEQIDPAQSEKVDARTDVYALGLILHELATGTQPFIDNPAEFNHQAVIMRKLTVEIPELTRLLPGFPKDISDIIARACQTDIEKRHSSMEELSDALAAVMRRRADERRAEMLGDADSSLEAPTERLGTANLPDPDGAVSTVPKPPPAQPVPPQQQPPPQQPPQQSPALPQQPQQALGQSGNQWLQTQAMPNAPPGAVAPSATPTAPPVRISAESQSARFAAVRNVGEPDRPSAGSGRRLGRAAMVGAAVVGITGGVVLFKVLGFDGLFEPKPAASTSVATSSASTAAAPAPCASSTNAAAAAPDTTAATSAASETATTSTASATAATTTSISNTTPAPRTATTGGAWPATKTTATKPTTTTKPRTRTPAGPNTKLVGGKPKF